MRKAQFMNFVQKFRNPKLYKMAKLQKVPHAVINHE